MTRYASWICEYPGCDKRAVTQCRTTLLPWMKLCRRHRDTWERLEYPDLVAAYQNAGPHKMALSGEGPWMNGR